MGSRLRKLKFLSILLIITYFLYHFKTKSGKNHPENEIVIPTTTNTINASENVTMPPDIFSEEVRDKLDKLQKITKLIILSVNPRSGSSYVADILSSPPRTSLWQEPLRFLYEKPPMQIPSRKVATILSFLDTANVFHIMNRKTRLPVGQIYGYVQLGRLVN